MDAAEIFLPVARELTLQAGKRVKDLLHTELVRARKADRSLVTNADHISNDLLRRGLRKEFPSHSLLSEESGLEGRSDAEYLWLVDPLDGTKAYAKGQPGFSVMVALLHRLKPVLGLVFDPLEGRLYEAVRGRGCFHGFRNHREKVRVSRRKVWRRMPLVTSPGFPEELRSHIRKTLGTPMLEPINSVGVKVGLLVRQRADLYVNHHGVHFWDTAAPALILQEAGGTFTHWDGSPLTYSPNGTHRHTGPTLATNRLRHQELLSVLAKAPGF